MLTRLPDGHDRPLGGKEFRAVVATSLRDLPSETLRRLAWCWPRQGDLAERAIARAINEELLRRPASS